MIWIQLLFQKKALMKNKDTLDLFQLYKLNPYGTDFYKLNFSDKYQHFFFTVVFPIKKMYYFSKICVFGIQKLVIMPLISHKNQELSLPNTPTMRGDNSQILCEISGINGTLSTSKRLKIWVFWIQKWLNMPLISHKSWELSPLIIGVFGNNYCRRILWEVFVKKYALLKNNSWNRLKKK